MSSPKKHEQLSKRPYEIADLLYHYCQLSLEGSKQLIDYGTGELFSAVEAHTVTRIEEHPGITVTEIAQQTGRTKGAVSQIISKLEEKGMIRREADSKNARKSRLYLTAAGLELSRCHKEYDERSVGDDLDRSIERFGLEAVENLVQIIDYWGSRSSRKEENED